MKNKQNLHIHTNYVDGMDAPEEIIIEAIAKNFDSIGFSEHSYLKYSSFPHQLTAEKMNDYQNEIKLLKAKYSNSIDIFCGLEFDFYSDVSVEFDYLIGSVHYLNCGGDIVTFDKGSNETLDFIRTYFNGNALKFAEKYYETVALLPQKNSFDILGHFDLITKNNEKNNFIDINSGEYLNLGFEAIHSLKGKIPLFEVNTGAISRGYRKSPYPQMEFLKEFNRCGFGIVITSDCHNKKFIDCFYNEAEEMISAAGFKSKWILTGNGFKEVEL